MLSTKTPMLAPPLARLSLLVVPFAVAIVGVGMVLPWLAQNTRTTRKIVIGSAASCVASLLIYACFVQLFVAPVVINSQNRTVYVTVGAKRDQPYRQLYKGKRNSDVLKDQGYQEDDIDRVWIPASVFITRFMGLLSYICILGSINICIGALARTRDLTEGEPSP
jgi:hypothetical protein